MGVRVFSLRDPVSINSAVCQFVRDTSFWSARFVQVVSLWWIIRHLIISYFLLAVSWLHARFNTPREPGQPRARVYQLNCSSKRHRIFARKRYTVTLLVSPSWFHCSHNSCFCRSMYRKLAKYNGIPLFGIF